MPKRKKSELYRSAVNRRQIRHRKKKMINNSIHQTMAANIHKLKYPIIVVNIERTERKTYMVEACLQEAINKAIKFGCYGSILLDDADGSEICDDEILEYHLQRRATFMICNHCSDWKSQSDPAFFVEKEKKSVTRIQISPQEIKANTVSDVRNLTLNKKNETVATETTPSELNFTVTTPSGVNFTVTSSDNVENSKIFKEAEYCYLYPEFADFEIQWSMVPLDIMEMLANGEPLLRRTNALANFLIDELRLLKPNLSMPVMRRVAERVVSLYPQSFQPPGVEKSLAELSSAFLAVLKNRYFNVLRGLIKTKRVSKKYYRPELSSANDQNSNDDVTLIDDVNLDHKIEYDSLSSFE